MEAGQACDSPVASAAPRPASITRHFKFATLQMPPQWLEAGIQVSAGADAHEVHASRNGAMMPKGGRPASQPTISSCCSLLPHIHNEGLRRVRLPAGVRLPGWVGPPSSRAHCAHRLAHCALSMLLRLNCVRAARRCGQGRGPRSSPTRWRVRCQRPNLPPPPSPPHKCSRPRKHCGCGRERARPVHPGGRGAGAPKSCQHARLPPLLAASVCMHPLPCMAGKLLPSQL